jgi:hypothetical protein
MQSFKLNKKAWRWFLCLILVLPIFSCSKPETFADNYCHIDKNQNLKKSFKDFDQDLNNGWRKLSNRECFLQSAQLIGQYIDKNQKTLNNSQIQMLKWHQAQNYANIPDYSSARQILLQLKYDDEVFEAYRKATIAFLENDFATLKSARYELSIIPRPDGFDQEARVFKEKYNKAIIWPPNLDVVDGLIKCFDKPYKIAYSDANCRLK